MRVLDLFCGAGGASVGYYDSLTASGIKAEIVGVDIISQPDYPFEFIQADALTYPTKGFDLVHASPPCQGYSSMSNRYGSEHPLLIDQVRGKLEGLEYVIENVVGASGDMFTTLMLCGTMFGLPTRRHRLFETSMLLWQPNCGEHTRGLTAVYGKPDGRRLNTYSDGEISRAWASIEEGQEALGINWTDAAHQLREAIPPAYTRYIGENLEGWVDDE